MTRESSNKQPIVRRKIRLGKIYADDITFSGAIDRIIGLARNGGGHVVTPNVDHVVLAEHSPDFLQAYLQADLSLVDGQPLMWIARALREPFPEKISGSDLLRPVCAEAAKHGLGVYILGASPESAKRAIEILRAEYPGLRIVGHASPMLPGSGEGPDVDAAMADIRAAKPDILFAALGSPKQEILLHKQKAAYAPALAIGVGAAVDFVAGAVQRAPKWMSNAGLEWFYRLSKEPKRLAHRYLVRDREILPIFLRMLKLPQEDRVIRETERN